MNPFIVFAEFKSRIQWDDSSFDTWKYRSAKQVEIDKKAKCNDATSYLHSIINDSEVLQYEIRKLDNSPIVVRDGEEIKNKWIHNNLLFKFEGYYYIAEWMWCTVYRSIFGPFETKEELISNFIIMATALINEKLNDKFIIKQVEFKNPPYGITINEYQESY